MLLLGGPITDKCSRKRLSAQYARAGCILSRVRLTMGCVGEHLPGHALWFVLRARTAVLVAAFFDRGDFLVLGILSQSRHLRSYSDWVTLLNPVVS